MVIHTVNCGSGGGSGSECDVDHTVVMGNQTGGGPGRRGDGYGKSDRKETTSGHGAVKPGARGVGVTVNTITDELGAGNTRKSVGEGGGEAVERGISGDVGYVVAGGSDHVLDSVEMNDRTAKGLRGHTGMSLEAGAEDCRSDKRVGRLESIQAGKHGDGISGKPKCNRPTKEVSGQRDLEDTPLNDRSGLVKVGQGSHEDGHMIGRRSSDFFDFSGIIVEDEVRGKSGHQIRGQGSLGVSRNVGMQGGGISGMPSGIRPAKEVSGQEDMDNTLYGGKLGLDKVGKGGKDNSYSTLAIEQLGKGIVHSIAFTS